MRKSKALMRLYAIDEELIYKKNGNLIFRQRSPNTPVYISFLTLIASLITLLAVMR